MITSALRYSLSFSSSGRVALRRTTRTLSPRDSIILASARRSKIAVALSGCCIMCASSITRMAFLKSSGCVSRTESARSYVVTTIGLLHVSSSLHPFSSLASLVSTPTFSSPAIALAALAMSSHAARVGAVTMARSNFPSLISSQTARRVLVVLPVPVGATTIRLCSAKTSGRTSTNLATRLRLLLSYKCLIEDR